MIHEVGLSKQEVGGDIGRQRQVSETLFHLARNFANICIRLFLNAYDYGGFASDHRISALWLCGNGNLRNITNVYGSTICFLD